MPYVMAALPNIGDALCSATHPTFTLRLSEISTKAIPCVEVWQTSNLRQLRLGKIEKKERRRRSSKTNNHYLTSTPELLGNICNPWEIITGNALLGKIANKMMTGNHFANCNYDIRSFMADDFGVDSKSYVRRLG